VGDPEDSARQTQAEGTLASICVLRGADADLCSADGGRGEECARRRFFLASVCLFVLCYQRSLNTEVAETPVLRVKARVAQRTRRTWFGRSR